MGERERVANTTAAACIVDRAIVALSECARARHFEGERYLLSSGISLNCTFVAKLRNHCTVALSHDKKLAIRHLKKKAMDLVNHETKTATSGASAILHLFRR